MVKTSTPHPKTGQAELLAPAALANTSSGELGFAAPNHFPPSTGRRSPDRRYAGRLMATQNYRLRRYACYRHTDRAR